MKKPIVYIPYHQKLDELCDFVFQTAKSLLVRGYPVTLIIYEYAHLFGDVYDQKYFSDTYKQLLRHPKFKIIRPVFHVTPHKGLRRLHKSNTTVFHTHLADIIEHTAGLLWVFWPEDAELVQRVKRLSPDSLCFYDCVDNFTSTDHDLDKLIRKQEAGLIRDCDHVFVNSRSLYQMKCTVRSDIQQVPLGFDEKSFKKAERKIPSDIDRMFADIPKPIIGYCGYLTFRLDYALLMKLIRETPNSSFVFLGPTKIFPYEIPEKETIHLIERLTSLPNVYMIPPIASKAETARAVSRFDIGIIPYDISYPYNRYCFPMKLFEYFYLGKPVISTPIIELERFLGYVKLCESAKEWETIMREILSKPWPERMKKEQKRLAVANSWEKKISRIVTFIH